jgi:hypothetical protein
MEADCLTAPTNMVGWWPGDGNANDITTNNNNGTLLGGATATNTGIVAQCFRFDGANGYVKITNSSVLEPSTLTVECWVKFASLDNTSQTANAGHQYIVFKQNTVFGIYQNFGIAYGLGKDRYPNVPVPTTGDGFYFNVMDSKGKYPEVDATNVIATNVWYHLAGVRGPNYIQLYVNGQFQGQVAAPNAQYYNGHWPLYFGTTGQSYWDGKLNGMLDEVSLYNRALSSNEIAAIYNAGAGGKCKGMSNGGNPPVITNQPVGVGVIVSNNATFSVGVSGDAPLSYQWWFNGTNAVGQNTNVLTLNTVQVADAGNYSVVVTNGSGNVTSAPALLTVYVPPIITLQPLSITNLAGTTTGFSVMATGNPPPDYQWQFKGTNILGATTNTLTLTKVQPAQAGNYVVVVTNLAGAVTSSNALLSVIVISPVITVSADVLNNAFWLMFPTQNGLGYHLEYKDDLSATNDWQELTNVSGDGNPATLNLPTDETTMRYFRLRVQ